MKSTTSSNNGSNKGANGAITSIKEPTHLTTAAIKKLSDPSCAKHHSKLDYILQIVRVKDLTKPVVKGQESNGATETDEKKVKSAMKCK